MKEFLAAWIIFQLIIIGLVGANMEYDIKNNIYECRTTTDTSIVTYNIGGVIFPLIAFVSNDFGKTEYCKNN